MVVDIHNGYLDYVAAADAIQMAKTPNAFSDSMSTSLKTTELATAKRISQDFSVVLSHVIRGNQKKAWLPHNTLSFDTTFPELAAFRNVARVLRHIAYADLASGNSSRAVACIGEGLIFGEQISRMTLIHLLVSYANASMLMAALNDLTLSIPPQDALKLAQSVTTILESEPSVIGAMQAELKYQVAFWEKDFEKVGGVSGFLTKYMPSEPDEATKSNPLYKELTSMNDAQFRAAASRSLNKLRDRHRSYDLMLRGPESKWRNLDDPLEPSTVEDLLEDLMTPVFGQVIDASLTRRTQLRLLRLHLAISAFNWEHRRIPNTLSELPQKEWILDPLHGESFTYEITGRKEYRLYSKGTERGEIDMVLRPRATPTGISEPPVFVR